MPTNDLILKKLPNFISFYTTINIINVPGCSVHLNVALVVEQTENNSKIGRIKYASK